METEGNLQFWIPVLSPCLPSSTVHTSQTSSGAFRHWWMQQEIFLHSYCFHCCLFLSEELKACLSIERSLQGAMCCYPKLAKERCIFLQHITFFTHAHPLGKIFLGSVTSSVMVSLLLLQSAESTEMVWVVSSLSVSAAWCWNSAVLTGLTHKWASAMSWHNSEDCQRALIKFHAFYRTY